MPLKKIPLSQGKVALVDDSDFDELNRFKWCAMKNGNTFYAVRAVPDKTKRSGRRTIWMHRVILGPKKGEFCDHIDRNGLNNMRSNLRIASYSLNGFNQRARKDNTSGFKGVSWNKQCGKWQAQIKINSKNIYLGYFTTAKQASVAYQKAFKIRMAELSVCLSS